jgi:hypothetical protein
VAIVLMLVGAVLIVCSAFVIFIGVASWGGGLGYAAVAVWVLLLGGLLLARGVVLRHAHQS